MKIVTDTSALYTFEEAKEKDIELLPLTVTLDGKTYTEFEDMFAPEFLELIRESSSHPTSSQPPIGRTIDALEKYQEEEVLVICMADGLSGTYQSTCSARNSIEKQDNIHVINSKTLCGPHHELVEKAIAFRDNHMDIKTIIKELEETMKTQKSYLIPQDFGFLKRGGRLTPLAAKVGGMLKIVPVMMQTDDGKRLEKFTIKRTLKGAIDDIIDAFKNMLVDSDYVIYVSHADALKQACEIKEQIQKSFKDVEILMRELTPAFIVQGGPGCIAIQTIKK